MTSIKFKTVILGIIAILTSYVPGTLAMNLSLKSLDINFKGVWILLAIGVIYMSLTVNRFILKKGFQELIKKKSLDTKGNMRMGTDLIYMQVIEIGTWAMIVLAAIVVIFNGFKLLPWKVLIQVEILSGILLGCYSIYLINVLDKQEQNSIEYDEEDRKEFNLPD